MSMKNSSDTIRNRTRHLMICSAVPQPLRHRVPLWDVNVMKFLFDRSRYFKLLKTVLQSYHKIYGIGAICEGFMHFNTLAPEFFF
jgi:hypothetical protein